MRDLDLHIDRTLRSSKWLEKHLRDPIGVEELSYEAGYSMHHYIRVFRGVTGRSPIEFLQQRRLTWAAQVLLESKHPVQYVAQQAGYDSPSSFGRAFRRQYGVTPLAYRSGGEHHWFKDVDPLGEERLWHQLGGGIKLMHERLVLENRFLWGLTSVQDYGRKSREIPLADFLEKCPAQLNELWELRWSNAEDVLAAQYHQAYALEAGPQMAFDQHKLFVVGGSYAVFRHRGVGDRDFFHSCNFIFQRYMAQAGVQEDRMRPTLIRHLGSEDSWLDCKSVDIYIPILD